MAGCGVSEMQSVSKTKTNKGEVHLDDSYRKNSMKDCIGGGGV